VMVGWYLTSWTE